MARCRSQRDVAEKDFIEIQFLHPSLNAFCLLLNELTFFNIDNMKFLSKIFGSIK